MPKVTMIKLLRVRFMPKTLEEGILYYSEEFGSAIHLCACGCGAKVSTPIGPAEWSLAEAENGPTLDPSIGNWQHDCQSHYWIRNGRIIWSTQWSSEQVALGRGVEAKRREVYYESRKPAPVGPLQRIWEWIKSLVGR
jgi:hypothetical protein